MSVLLVKQRINISEPPFGGVVFGGNICDSSLARRKARSWLPIGYNWTFFASSYGCGTNTSKLAFAEGGGLFWVEDTGRSAALFKGVGHFKRKFQVEGDIAHQRLLVPESYSDYSFMWYQNIGSMFFHFVTKHACDRHTYRITISKTTPA